MPDDQPPPNDPIIQLEQVRKQRLTNGSRSGPDAPAEFSDDALALQFVDQHPDRLRHVAAWGKWMLWKGSHWVSDDTLKAFDLSRAMCRSASAKVSSEKLSAALASAKTVASVITLARSDRRVASTVDQWDALPTVLNMPE
jgi:putative DNA primase/helicase